MARYSGKKFGCILLGVDPENSMMMSERLRKGSEDLKIPHALSTVSEFVTLSFGVSTMSPAKNNSIEALIKSAEEALKQSKVNGKNRVTKAVRTNGRLSFISN